MWTLVQIGILVAIYMYNRSKAPDPPKRAWERNPTVPTTEEGTPLPLIYGQIRVNAPPLVWWGNFTQRAGFPPYDLTTVYGIQALFVLGLGPDVQYATVTNPAWPTSLPMPVNHKLVGMYWGDKYIPLGVLPDETSNALEYSAGGVPLNPNGPGGRELHSVYADLGGAGAGGYVALRLQFWDGHEGGIGNNYQDIGHQLTLGFSSVDNHPGYAHQLCVYLYADSTVFLNDNIYSGDAGGSPLDSLTYSIGESANLPSIGFEVCTGHTGIVGLYGAGDANPIDVIKDIITGNQLGKLHMDPGVIDSTSFDAAFATLEAENHGYSRFIQDAVPAPDLLGELVQQIGAILWVDNTTTTFKIKLLRADYVLGSCPQFDETNIVDVEGYSSNTWNETFTQVRATFNNRGSSYIQGSVVANSLANAVGQDGRQRSKTVSYPGVCDPRVATYCATRDLTALGRPFAKFKMIANRSAETLSPGDVISVTWPKFGLTAVAFRVLGVDVGELHDGRVRVDVLQDAFADAVSATTTVTSPQQATYPPNPGLKYLVEEAPRFMQQLAVQNGVIPDADGARVWGLVSDLVGTSISAIPDVRQLVKTKSSVGSLTDDVYGCIFPTTFTLYSSMDREAEPYDTSFGAIIYNKIAPPLDDYPWDPAATFTAAQIRDQGMGLFMIGSELIGYESATLLGGSPAGRYRLNNVWRGLGGTVPVAHAAGELCVHVGAECHPWKFIGHKTYGGTPWDVVLTPLSAQVLIGNSLSPQWGSGDDPTVQVQSDIRVRTALGHPAADVTVYGATNMMAGSGGLGGYGAIGFKSVYYYEEGFGVLFRQRDRLSTTLARGDDASESVETGVSYELGAKKVISGSGLEVDLGPWTTSDLGAKLLLGGAGYGDVDVYLHTRRLRPTGTTAYALEWQTPTVRITAPRWRNLLGNPHFNLSTLGGTDPGPCWTGTTVGVDSTVQIDHSGSNPLVPYCHSKATTGSVVTQTVDVAGYQARGMTALLYWWEANLKALGDVETVTLTPLDAGGSTLSGAVVDASTPPIVASAWTRKKLSIASLPALTSKLKVNAALDATTQGLPGTGFCEASLQVGQLLDDVLTNGALAVGTGWTSTSFLFGQTAIISQGPMPSYAQGGAAASSNTFQEYTLLTSGWDEGTTAVLDFWRAQTLASDSGTVTVEYRDGSGTVLASVTTGAVTMAALNTWYHYRLYLDSVPGATKIRVTLAAVRTLGAGNSGACFAAVNLQVHKDLGDARQSTELILSSPSVQPLPLTWSAWMRAYPTLAASFGTLYPIVFAAQGLHVSRRKITTPQPSLRWSDGVIRQMGRLVAQWGGGNAWMDAYWLARTSGSSAVELICQGDDDIALTGGDGFTVVVYIQTDESTWIGGCGVCGRLDAASGWGIGIDATGHATATVRGAGGTYTVVRTGSVVNDGALHMLVLAYDWNADTLTIYDERGGNTVSTAGSGDIRATRLTTTFRIGRAQITENTMPGKIAAVYLFPEGVLLDSTMIASLWNYGKDPNGKLTVTRAAKAWTFGVPEGRGSTAVAYDSESLCLMAADQVAFGYDADLLTFADANVGDAMGLAVCKAVTNLCPSFDFTDAAKWTPDSTASIALGTPDGNTPNGRAKSATLTMDATHGIVQSSITLGAGSVVTISFYASCATIATMDMELQNSSGVVKNTQTVNMDPGTGNKWRRYTVTFTGWDASTATARIRWRGHAGALIIGLCEVMFIKQGISIPSLWPELALGSIGDVTASVTSGVTYTKQHNMEGELIAEGVCTTDSPGGPSTIARVMNGTNDKNRRELMIDGTLKARFDHYDATTPTDVQSLGSVAVSWSQPWALRGRWRAAKTLDNATNPYAGLVVRVGAGGAVYGRSATFSYDGTLDTKLELGVGSNAPDMLVRRLLLRTAEEKLV